MSTTTHAVHPHALPTQEFGSQILVYHLCRDLSVAHDLGAVYAEALHRGDARKVSTLWQAHCYQPVAIVRAGVISVIGGNELDKAFEKTNNIEEAWATPEQAKRFGVTPLCGERARSTMTGDVMVAIVPGKATRYWSVCCIGFEELPIKQT